MHVTNEFDFELFLRTVYLILAIIVIVRQIEWIGWIRFWLTCYFSYVRPKIETRQDHNDTLCEWEPEKNADQSTKKIMKTLKTLHTRYCADFINHEAERQEKNPCFCWRESFLMKITKPVGYRRRTENFPFKIFQFPEMFWIELL